MYLIVQYWIVNTQKQLTFFYKHSTYYIYFILSFSHIVYLYLFIHVTKIIYYYSLLSLKDIIIYNLTIQFGRLKYIYIMFYVLIRLPCIYTNFVVQYSRHCIKKSNSLKVNIPGFFVLIMWDCLSVRHMWAGIFLIKKGKNKILY